MVRPCRAGYLNASDSDAAAGAVNQNSLRRARLRGVIERVIRGSVGDPNAGALAEADFFWKPVDLAFERDRVFGVRAGHRLRHVDAVARLYFGDAGADRFHRAGAVRAGRVRQRRLDGVRAVAHVSVVGIHANRVNAHEHLPRGGFRRGDFFELQDFGTAEFVNDYGFHFMASGSLET